LRAEANGHKDGHRGHQGCADAGARGDVSDLTEGDSVQADVDVWGGAGTSEPPAADVRGAYVKDKMGQVARELAKVRQHMPRVYEHMRKN
jgi:hypothetical protein